VARCRFLCSSIGKIWGKFLDKNESDKNS
jgi:hypothetical protein